MSNSLVEHSFTARGDIRTCYEDSDGRTVKAYVQFDPAKNAEAYVFPEKSDGQHDYVLFLERHGTDWYTVRLYRLGSYLHASELDEIVISGSMKDALEDAVELKLTRERANPMIIGDMPNFDPDNGSEM